MSATAQEVAGSAANTATAAHQADKEAKAGNRVVSQTIQTITQAVGSISQMNTQTAAAAEEINQNVVRISDATNQKVEGAHGRPVE